MNFMTEMYADPEKAREQFMVEVKQLAKYSTATFETYFFTAPSTQYYFSSAPDSLTKTDEFQADQSSTKHG